MKNAHIHLQMYLFFGAFALGFVHQAGPKLLGVESRVRANVLVQLLLLVVSTVLLCIYPQGVLGLICIALVFAEACRSILVLVFRNRLKVNYCAAFFLLIGLAGFALSTLVDISIASGALFAFWISLAPLLLASSEQFMAGFLGGKKSRGANALVLCLLYSLSAISGIWQLIYPSEIAWMAFGISALLMTCWYGVSTKLLVNALSNIKKPLGLAFTLGYLWLFGSLVAMLFASVAAADFVFHAMALGWASTILLAVSCQIMGHLSGAPLLRPAYLFALLLLWQLVVAGRTLVHFLPYRIESAWLVQLVSTIVLLTWVVQLVRAELRIVRRQRQLRQGERLGSC